MCFRAFVIFLSFQLLIRDASSQVPVGNWRDHLPYHSASKVVKGKDRIFCATPYSLFSIDAENNIERFSKTNGLSEVGISAISWDDETGKLLVAYSNSNIDMLNGNKITNIDAVKRKEIQADKSINSIYCYRQMAYLATGLGIIVIDENKAEVKDTYIIGNTGNIIKVTGVTISQDFIYAATAEGLKKAAVNISNLADYRNWELMNGNNGLGSGPVEQVVNLQDKIVVQKNDSLFVPDGNSWKLLYASEWRIINTNVSSGRLVLSQRDVSGRGRVVVVNPEGAVLQTIEQANTVVSPQQAIIDGADTWIADLTAGLLRSSSTGIQFYQPNSPKSIATGEMAVLKDALWVAAGAVSSDWNNMYNSNGLYKLTSNEWSNYHSGTLPGLADVYDVLTVAIDPRDQTVWAGSFGRGLVHLKENQLPIIFRENSPVEAALTDPGSYRVAGLSFDKDNHLWIANYGAAENLLALQSDGRWSKFSIPYPHADNAVSPIVIDNENQKWIVSPNGNGLFCFNHGSTIDNPGDDRWRYFRAGSGNGNLPDNYVLCIAKDKSGFIWVGTPKGIAIIQCPRDIFSNTSCEAVLPLVQQDNFAGYLFRDEEVQSIAVDGADRKWIGTKNGAWLLSADAEKTIYHFKDDNSPLLNNDIRKITIDPASGEVFFATSKGICSFRSTATEGSSTNYNVLVFPNPVPPAFNGTIAIRGLVNNAIVKITEMDGRLVYQTRALGGQAVWTGRDYKGRKISSGVYLVLVSDDRMQEKMVTKIVFIQ